MRSAAALGVVRYARSVMMMLVVLPARTLSSCQQKVGKADALFVFCFWSTDIPGSPHRVTVFLLLVLSGLRGKKGGCRGLGVFV